MENENAKAYNITISNYSIPAVPQMIKFLHAAAGYPVISTWLNAIQKDHFMGWPGLCAETVRQHLLPSPHTGKGHMKMVRQNRHAKTKTPNPPIKTAHKVEYRIINTEDLPNEVTKNSIQAHQLAIVKSDDGKYMIKNLISTDLPGRYPITSACGHKYIFLLYDHDTNYIHACPIKSRKAEDLIIGFSTCYAELK